MKNIDFRRMFRLAAAAVSVAAGTLGAAEPAGAVAQSTGDLRMAAPVVEELPVRNGAPVSQKIFRARFYLCNRGPAPVRIATRFPMVLARADVRTPGKPIWLELGHWRSRIDPARGGGEAAAGSAPFILAFSPEELGIMELRPGEGVPIVREFLVNSAHWANSDKTVVIRYCPNNLDGRYDFLRCDLQSRPLTPVAPGSRRAPEPVPVENADV